MAHIIEERDGKCGSGSGGQKRKLNSKRTPPKKEDSVPGGSGAEQEGGDESEDDIERTIIFKYLTPSDLRLTADALLSTKKSHFHCNVNGCTRSLYASLPLLPLFLFQLFVCSASLSIFPSPSPSLSPFQNEPLTRNGAHQ
jgi:hypothetical protein